ncbi:hypothetical protein PF005_g26450 [Phytophthora fragariae]|uniref:Lipoprotein n=1 Tax=Phytophthora fragariae TaxID=53985 RepID=A0A6A3R1W0_9STRA|nr:hypothetical protein PF003_g40777 [Phytophthora fragariae]KAE8935505.1 hypothetical protein PF009_g14548 [Phytophthora fragariae]KAE8974052.1 hypothetical protein PF011_g25009 [Phytophthora fragariae]KAE9071112.1 hypothetical protein PF010_g26003 [Phytophthora fragariae]KAE9071697.1 hypothetical protein PF007_g26461 [Phytophthora fragariae]
MRKLYSLALLSLTACTYTFDFPPVLLCASGRRRPGHSHSSCRSRSTCGTPCTGLGELPVDVTTTARSHTGCISH